MLFKHNTPGGQPATKPAEPAAPAKLTLPSQTPTGAPAKAPVTSATADPGPASTDLSDSSKRLIVGEGIQLKGEITACDRLVVEGEVEVTLKTTRALEIKPSGRFTGSCEVEDAEVSGVYDGDLIVRGRLVVRTGGRVTGDITYGEIEVERGAQIMGELSVREQTSAAAPPRNDTRRNAA